MTGASGRAGSSGGLRTGTKEEEAGWFGKVNGVSQCLVGVQARDVGQGVVLRGLFPSHDTQNELAGGQNLVLDFCTSVVHIALSILAGREVG